MTPCVCCSLAIIRPFWGPIPKKRFWEERKLLGCSLLSNGCLKYSRAISCCQLCFVPISLLTQRLLVCSACLDPLQHHPRKEGPFIPMHECRGLLAQGDKEASFVYSFQISFSDSLTKRCVFW